VVQSSKKKKTSKHGKSSRIKKTLKSVNKDQIFDHDEIKKLSRLMEENEIGEIEWSKNGESFRLRALSSFLTSQSQPFIFPDQNQMSEIKFQKVDQPNPTDEKLSTPLNAEKALSNQKKVLSPFVGTFYRAPAPDAENYVEVGHAVKPGDVLCIVEAMKLMNEIEAEISGKVVSVLVESGEPVEFGEPLFIIETK